ncbi:MAG: hypothetical protein ABI600_15035 [Luteolibacter sp.]
MSDKPEKKVSFENNPLFIEVMKEALAIQDRFAAEPIYSRTGKGYLKSGGVTELEELKQKQKAVPNKTNR